jgi:hypothetical protein
MAYEIWDGESGNLLIVRPSRSDALAVIREAIAKHGEQYIDSLALILEDESGETHVLAEGQELARLAITGQHRANHPHVAD